jgi:hypothetical protein
VAWRFATDPDPASAPALPWLELVSGRFIKIHPPAAAKDDPAGGTWEGGETYLVAMRGGEQGLRGAPKPGGPARVEADALFYLLRQTQRLDVPEHEAVFPYRTHAERVARAKQAEAIRVLFSPFLDGLAAGPKWPRTEVAAMWTFTVTRRPELFFDPDSSRIPLPNDLLRDPVARKVTLPILATDGDAEKETKTDLSTLDGFSTTGDVTIRFTRPIELATVTSATVKLVDRLGEPVAFIPELSKDAKNLYLHVTDHGSQTLLPLEEASAYAVFLTDGVLGKDGRPVSPMPLGVMTVLPEAIEADGHTTLDPLVDDGNARLLEGARLEVAPFLARSGLDRLHLGAGFAFTTQSITKPLLVLRQEVRGASGPSTTVDGFKTSTPADHLLVMPSVSKIVEGDLRILDHLDPVSHKWSEAAPRETKIPFLLILPSGVTGKLKTMVFGHGLTSTRGLAYQVANTFAAHGYATMAIDFPYHGDRTICLTNNDCAQGTCSPDGVCRNADGSKGSLIIVNNQPTMSGNEFVDLEHLKASRDHFLQALSDLHQTVRVLESGDFSPMGVEIDAANLHYSGMSLGGIIGALFVPLEPDILSAPLIVPGGDMPDLMEHSGTFGPILALGLSQKGIQQGTDAYMNFKTAGHWMLDETDPMNLVRHIQVDPLTVDGQRKAHRAYLQRATLDTVIPGPCTDILGRLGALKVTDWIGSHAYYVDLSPIMLPAQEQAASFLDGVNP